ncbi:ABC transporter permease [Streptomyces botrytidirepellens]|uniref:Transport permease protein n=1 Tax=Streptomyces botrytidirepellens TaxID=2486417 RepID=A0A3M8VP87_9ACTN|nr:ABC transporter permease [Streptomyces botrytidirepellens]RNG18245.1 ABC transporter permease [Streptomyces botrytidirepellens]
MSSPTIAPAPRRTTTHPFSDALTMLGRNLTRMQRDPSQVIVVIALPVIFLLLFVYVFGNTLGAGISVSGTDGYLGYVVPGILIIGLAASAQGTSVSVNTDMTEGIIARFRTMAIARGAVLTGHVAGAIIQTLLGIVGVLAISLLLGYRPAADATDWLGVVGVLTLITFALSWLAVAIGTFANSATVASNMPMPLVLLPFLGSSFVPAESMPDGLRWFSEYQPFTPFIESVRSLLDGAPAGDDILATAIWSFAIAVLGYVWALAQYNRKSIR